MKYYAIQNSLNEKILGNVEQIKSTKFNCSVTNEPKFVDKIYYEKVDYEPIVANPVLFNNSKMVDLINSFGMGSSFKILISGKLKSILENNRKTGMQFFQCSVFKKDEEYKDYWLLNMYEADNEFINIKESHIILWRKREDFLQTYETFPIRLNIETFNDYQTEINKSKIKDESLMIQKLTLINEINQDFFRLERVEGGMNYFVSEKLKQEIENAGCVGIEFQPSELSYNEWSVSGGRRDQVYGKSW